MSNLTMTSIYYNVVTSSFYDVDVSRSCNVEFNMTFNIFNNIFIIYLVFLSEINMFLKERLVSDVWILKSTILTWNKQEIKFKAQFTPQCPIWTCIVANEHFDS